MSDVDPLIFPPGGANSGMLSVNEVPLWDSSSFDLSLCAGSGAFQATGACAGKTSYDLTIVQAIQTVHQNPQGSGDPVTAGDPMIVDSLWTITNTSGMSFQNALVLAFTNVNVGDTSIVPGGYPDLETALDENVVDIMTHMTGSGPVFFGVTPLGVSAGNGSFDDGDVEQILVRYIVRDGPLPIVSSMIVLPPLAVVGLAVPEPALPLLLAAAALLSRRSRQRRPN